MKRGSIAPMRAAARRGRKRFAGKLLLDGGRRLRILYVVTQTHRRQVHGIAGWRRAVLWPLVAVMRLWGRTLRIDTTDTDPSLLGPRDEPVIFVLWHNRLFVVPELYRRLFPSKQIHALISASKDGAWLAAFFELAGLGTVRGSSSKYGRQALHGLAHRLAEGDDVGLTPDGPRGPAYRFKAGTTVLARKTGARSMLLGINYDRAWRVPSWDRFFLPKPWSTVRLSVAVRTAGELREDGAVERMEADLVRLNPDPIAPGGRFECEDPSAI
jgi:lysophospholipid acyltransferase (LPLAT)-like uncharacterized protein